MAIILFIAVQPPNERCSRSSLASSSLPLVLWFGVENKRFKGPPMGDEIKRRQAEIAKKEAAFGEA